MLFVKVFLSSISKSRPLSVFWKKNLNKEWFRSPPHLKRGLFCNERNRPALSKQTLAVWAVPNGMLLDTCEPTL